MKILLEIEVDTTGFSYKKGMTEDSKVELVGKRACAIINDLIMNKSMDHSEYIPDVGTKRFIDLMGDVSVCSLQTIRDIKIAKIEE